MKTALVLLCALLCATSAMAQSRSAPAQISETATAQDTAKQRLAREKELQAVRDRLRQAQALRARLEGEVQRTDQERDAVARALIESARRTQDLEGDIAATQTRLDDLEENRSRIRSSLSERRGVLMDVVAALQRMGANPPPALLVKPEDALSAVRSALLLGAVVPRVQAQAQALRVELEALARTGQAIATEKLALAKTMERLAEDETRLNVLAENKGSTLETSSSDIATAVANIADLSEEAGSLETMIASLNRSIETSRQEAEAARLADEKRVQQEQSRLALARNRLREGFQPQDPLNPAIDLNSGQPTQQFGAARGTLQLPAKGRSLHAFGDLLAVGTTRKVKSPNMALSTKAGEVVRAPTGGRVDYAGSFRSYGEVLILDAGDGYNVVLSGMGRVTVPVGSAVVAGQPVGLMGKTAARRAIVTASSSVSLGLNEPVLYIEFRKNGRPVDPAPWWSTKQALTNQE